MSLNQAILSFNGGEITPYLAYTNNIAKHASSCARMENFLPMPFGGFRKRPGTLDLAELPAVARLETFTFSDGNSNVFAFTAEALFIFDPDGSLVATITESFPAPFELQFSQINDIIDIASMYYPPRQLSGNGSSWTLIETPFDFPPLLDENTNKAKTLAATTTPTTPVMIAKGAAVTLTASQPLFDAGHAGAVFQISKKRDATDYERSLKAVNGSASTGLEVSDSVFFSTGSTEEAFDGTWTIEKSLDGGTTWTAERTFSGAGDRNVPVTEIKVDEPCLMRVRYAGTTHNPSRGILAATSAFVRGLVRIGTVTSSTVATGVTLTRLPSAATSFWAEGAFSDFQGFPRAVTLHDRRRVFAGTRQKPMSLWFSKTDDLLDFEAGTDADSGIYSTLASIRQSPIVWLASQRRMFVGTEAGEWVIGSDRSDALLSPENFLAREYTRFGSAKVPALTFNDSVYFVERQGLRLRELAYVLERETFDAANLSRLAERIPPNGADIVQMSWQQSRESFLWSITSAGMLLAFAIHRQEDIAAWSRHTTKNGLFRSVAVLRKNSDDDDVYFCVERGEGVFRLEKFAASQQAAQENKDLSLAHFVDAGIYLPTAGTSVSVPAHLEGQYVSVLANGSSREEYVLDGHITLPEPTTHLHVGLSVYSQMDSLPQDIQVENGTTHSRMKRAHELRLAVFNSWGGSYLYGDEAHDINYITTDNFSASSPDLVTAWLDMTLDPLHMQDLTFGIGHIEPYPFICRAAVLSWEIHER